MSIDKLQTRIRKLKNPSALDLGIMPEHIPSHLRQAHSTLAAAYQQFCEELLAGLKEVIPAVRFNLGASAAYGPDGMLVLSQLLRFAKDCGYYVMLDIPDARSQMDAQRNADVLFCNETAFCFDGIITSVYIGSDGLRPYVEHPDRADRDVFVITRTSNRSAQELQDLLTGSRLVHMATADIVNRYSEAAVGRCGYSQIAAVAAAASPDSIKALRAKYKNLFLLLDGYDYPNANAKNCSFAFDRLGHGAVACAGLSITGAWQEGDCEGEDFVPAALDAAERMKRNLTRYVTIL